MEAVISGVCCVLVAPICLLIGYRMGRKEAQKETKELAKTFEYLANKLMLKLGLAEIEIEELRREAEEEVKQKRKA